MPKVNLTPPPRPDMKLRAILRYAVLETLGAERLAAKLSRGKTYVYARLNDPMRFDLYELKKIREISGMTREEFTELIAPCI